jgi:hypothetical protein
LSTHGLGKNVNAGADKAKLQQLLEALRRAKNEVPIDAAMQQASRVATTRREMAQQRREDALLIMIADCALSFAVLRRDSMREALRDGRDDFKMPVADPETAARRMVELKERLQKQFLQTLKQAQTKDGPLGVSIAADSTTVWKGRYVSLVVQWGEWSVLFACDGDDDDKFKGELTGDNLTEFFNFYVDMIHATGCYCMNIVTDNGANFLKAAKQMTSTFSINCIAHGLNLCIEKACGGIPAIKSSVELAKSYHAENKLPSSSEFAETRWGSVVRLMEAVSEHQHRHTKALTLANLAKKLEINEKNCMDACAQGLKPFLIAINCVQSNTANVFVALQALAFVHSHVEKWKSPLPKTRDEPTLLSLFGKQLCDNLLSEPMLLGCWLSGCVAFSKFHHLQENLLPGILSSGPMCELARRASGTIKTNFLAQDLDPERYPEKAPMAALDESALRQHICDIKLVNVYLGCAAEVIFWKMKVTEADAERWFSRLKWTVPRLRGNLSTERAGASIVVNSISSFLTEFNRATTVNVDADLEAARAAALPVDDDDEEYSQDEECADTEMVNDEEDEECDVDENRIELDPTCVATFINYWLELLDNECKLQAPRAKKLAVVCAGCNKAVHSHSAAHGAKLVCKALNCCYVTFEHCCNLMTQVDADNYRCPKHRR